MKTFQPIIKDGSIDIRVNVIGMLSNNVYWISDGTTAVLVDPGTQPETLAEAIEQLPLKPSAILLTHFHSDHTGAAFEMRDILGVPVYASAIDAQYITGEIGGSDPLHKKYHICPVDVTLADNEEFSIGTLTFSSLLTPGHTSGSMCWILQNASSVPIMLSGDTLFEGTYGRTDFETGSHDDMGNSLMRLEKLSPETIVLPGHGNITSIGREARLFQMIHTGQDW